MENSKIRTQLLSIIRDKQENEWGEKNALREREKEKRMRA